MNLYNNTLIPLSAFIMSSILLYFYLKSRLAINDIPNERSMHKVTVKKSGGIFFILTLIVFLFFFQDNRFLLSGILFSWLIGIFDDLKNPGSRTKLLTELLFFLPFSFFLNKNILIFGFAFPVPLSVFILAVYFVFIMNLVNFMDGMDLYLVASTLAAILIFSFMAGGIQPALFFLLAVLVSFALFNFPPAKMFMGDSGSLPLGFIIAFMPFLAEKQSFELTDIIYLIPVFITDGILTIIKRGFRGENILKAHRQHLYQLVTEHGISKTATMVTFSLANLAGIPFLLSGNRVTGTVVLLLSFSAVYLVFHWKRSAPRGTRTPTLSSED